MVRRIARVATWIVLSLTLLVLVAVTTLILWARSESGRRILLSAAVSKAQAQLDGHLRIGRLDGDLTRVIALRDLRLYDRERQLAVSADTIRVEYDLFALLSRTVRVRALDVAGARVHPRWLRDGRLNLAALTKAPPPRPTASADTASASRRGWRIEVDALHAAGQTLVETTLGQAVRGSFRADAGLRLDGRDDELAGSLVVLAAGGELHAEAQASRPAGRALTWRGMLQSRALDPAALLPGAPHGNVGIAARGHGDEQRASIEVDELTLDSAGTHASLHGAVELGATMTGELRADLRATDLSPWSGLGLPALRGSIDAHADLRRTAEHTGGRVRVRAHDLDTSVLHLRGLSFTATGDEARFALALDATEARGTRATLRAHGVHLPDEGPWGLDVTVDTLRVGTRDAGWREKRPGRLRIDRDAAVVALALTAGHDETLALDGRMARDSGRLAADVQARRIDVSRFGLPTPIDADVHVEGPRLHAQVRGVQIATVDGIELTLDGEYRGRTARATIEAMAHGERLLTARAQSRVQPSQLLDAHRRRSIPVAADVTIPSVELSRLGPLGGTIAGAARIRGTLAHPTAKAELHGREVALSNLRLSSLDAHAAWDGAALTANVDAAQGHNGSLHVEASIPVASHAPLQARLEARSFTFALDGVGRVRRLEGTLDANLGASGTRAHPALEGFLRLEHGAFAGGTDPRLFRDLTVDVHAHGSTVELRGLGVQVNRGTLTAHGHLTLPGLEPKSFHLEAEAERFPFDPTNAGAWVNAHVELHGEKVGNRLEGKLTVAQGHAQLPALQQRRKLQSTDALEDVVFVDAPEPPPPSPSEPPPTPPLDVRIVAHIPGPFSVESPEMHAELRGELEARTVDGTLGVFGHAETTSGTFELLGREYDIERVRVSFHGDLDPELDVRLTRQLADTTVIIAVHGTISAPRVELSSYPPVYNSSQVLGLIVSGDPENQRVDSTAIDQQLVGALSGALVSKIKGQLVPGLPIDVIKVDTTTSDETFAGLRGARLEVGKYVRHDVYVGYVHHFGATLTDLHRTNSHEASIEYRPKRHFVIGVRYGDAGIGAIDFAWTLRY